MHLDKRWESPTSFEFNMEKTGPRKARPTKTVVAIFVYLLTCFHHFLNVCSVDQKIIIIIQLGKRNLQGCYKGIMHIPGS